MEVIGVRIHIGHCTVGGQQHTDVILFLTSKSPHRRRITASKATDPSAPAPPDAQSPIPSPLTIRVAWTSRLVAIQTFRHSRHV